jgi:hypothetical protein
MFLHPKIQSPLTVSCSTKGKSPQNTSVAGVLKLLSSRERTSLKNPCLAENDRGN